MRRPREDTQPWYKQFWPWFLISLPLSVVIASIVTINLAIQSNDGLVSDDYYKEGLGIHKNADSSARAKALGIAGALNYDSDTGAIRMRFDSGLPPDVGTLSLRAIHPTLPNQDQTVTLTPLGNNSYAGRLDPLGAAHWKLELMPADESWRIDGRLVLPANLSTRLE